MLLKALLFFIIIGALLWIAVARDKRRHRSLREWAELHPGAELFWPFASAEYPELPVGPMIEHLTGHLPLSLASAMRVRQAEGDVWWVEYRATQRENESSQWFTLQAQQCSDPAAAQLREEELQRTAPSGSPCSYESWVCQRHLGLLKVELLGL
jgi:hypothetical protein